MNTSGLSREIDNALAKGRCLGVPGAIPWRHSSGLSSPSIGAHGAREVVDEILAAR